MKMIDPNTRFNETLTEQEIFDHISYHLGTQDRRSVQSNGLCVYRGPNNRSCAVGYLLKDNEVDEKINGKGIRALYFDGYCPERLEPHVDLLVSLQGIHDTTSYWTDNRINMKHRLAHTASVNKLDSTILDNPDLAWNK